MNLLSAKETLCAEKTATDWIAWDKLGWESFSPKAPIYWLIFPLNGTPGRYSLYSLLPLTGRAQWTELFSLFLLSSFWHFVPTQLIMPIHPKKEKWNLLPSTETLSDCSLSHPCSLSHICYDDLVRTASLRILSFSSCQSIVSPFPTSLCRLTENLRGWGAFYAACHTAQTHVQGKERDRNPSM